MYQLTAIRKVNPELTGRKYSNGMECKDNTLSVMIDGDGALREIVTGLIHDGYTVTIEPGVWYNDTRDEEVSSPGGNIVDRIRRSGMHVTGPNSMPEVTSDMSTPVPTDSSPGR